MFKYKARIKEIGSDHICEPSYSSPMPVSQEFLIDFWGLENDDVEWYEITEENDY